MKGASPLKDCILNVRISQKTKLQLEKLAELNLDSKSSYLSRLISSTYHKYFDMNGELKDDYKASFCNDHL